MIYSVVAESRHDLEAIKAELRPQFSPKIGEVGLDAVARVVRRGRLAADDIGARGQLVEDLRAEMQPNPSVVIERMAAAELAKWLDKFGLWTQKEASMAKVGRPKPRPGV